jgi:hypothetical protein
VETNQIIADIARGKFDDDLDTLREVIENRRKVAASNLVYTLKPGDRVSLHGIRPKALDGATGTVKEVKRTRIGVVIDDIFAGGAGRFSWSIKSGLPLTVPVACIKPL